MFLPTLKRLFQPRRLSLTATPAFQSDPYPTYERLRREEPFYWDEPNGRWMLTRYADVMTVLRSPVASAHRAPANQRFVPAAFRPLVAFQSSTMLSSDDPKHHRLRMLVSKAFTARAIEAMAPKIQSRVDAIIDAALDRGRMDVMTDLAGPLPVAVIAEMLGVPLEDHDKFKKWSDTLALALSGAGNLKVSEYRRLAQAYQELSDYLAGIVAQRRVEPKDDLLTALAQAEESGDRLTEGELYANAALLLAAGHETTTNLIGNGTLALLRNPDQWARLKADPSLADTAVDEFLRYDSPVQFTARLLKDDLMIGGRQFRSGDLMLLSLGAANRDPEQFTDPERLNIERTENKHLAFGLGSHFCLGAQLARLEGRIVFETLARRLPGLRLDGSEPEFKLHPTLRGLKSLPVAF